MSYSRAITTARSIKVCGCTLHPYVKRPAVLHQLKAHYLCRHILPRAVLAVHAAFHVLYTTLAVLSREWCLQQNVNRVQVRGHLHSRSVWAAE